MKNIYTTSEWPALQQQTRSWRNDGATLVFANGCFDLLHKGHSALLDFAREQGDRVIIGLNTDSSVHALKGDGRPANDQFKRAQALLDTGRVDVIVFYAEETPLNIIVAIQPDVLIKGDDYSLDTMVGATEVVAYGGRALVFPRVPGYSSTELLKSIQTKKNETN